MSQPIWIVFLALAMGVATYVMVRMYAPWPEKHNNFFWLATLGPLVLLTLLGAPENFTQQFAYPFLAGLIVSEVLRPKYNAWQKKMSDMAKGKPPSNSKIVVKSSSKSKPSTPTKKKP